MKSYLFLFNIVTLLCVYNAQATDLIKKSIDQSNDQALRILLDNLDEQNAITAGKVISILGTITSKVDQLSHGTNHTENFLGFSSVLLHLHQILPFLNLTDASAFTNDDVANFLGYYAVMSTKTMYPPDAYYSLCLKYMNYREVVTPGFEATALNEISEKAAADGLTPEFYRDQLSNELKIAFSNQALTQLSRLRTYIAKTSIDQEAIQEIATSLKFNKVVAERYFVYTAVLLHIIPNALAGAINLEKFLSMTCTNFGYSKYTDSQLTNAASGIDYYKFLQELYKVSGTIKLSTISALFVVGLGHLYLTF